MVHCKNFVKRAAMVPVDGWVAETLAQLPGLAIRGVHVAPLGYRSAFQEWRRYPRRIVVTRHRALDGGWTEQLECGHSRHRAARPHEALPRAAMCLACGPHEGLVEVREERVVVAVRR